MHAWKKERKCERGGPRAWVRGERGWGEAGGGDTDRVADGRKERGRRSGRAERG